MIDLIEIVVIIKVIWIKVESVHRLYWDVILMTDVLSIAPQSIIFRWFHELIITTISIIDTFCEYRQCYCMQNA